MKCDGTFYRLDDVAVHFEPFMIRPFSLRKAMNINKQLVALYENKKSIINVF